MATEIKKCVIISGAPEDNFDYYKKYLDNSYIICADSGYLKCKKVNINPDMIIGDFDSSKYPDFDTKIIKLQVRKDDTDTFHCVKYAVEKGFNDVTILGGIGSRIDHTYANILSLVYCEKNNVNARLINNNNYITIISADNVISSNGYQYFSLYALFEKCTGVTISNASFNAENIDIMPYEQFTQSNEFVNGDVKININEGKLILFLSND